ncbi:MAG: Crp/Fnr family transcriptional regulator [Sinimarinibacterium sp.]|jgi:CRP-like cAMP-binding protein
MSDTPAPRQNHLLGALSERALTRLRPHLELASMPLGKILYDAGETMRHVYFPTDCIVSLLQVMENGASGEIAVVGNEGLIGIASFMGGESTPSRAIVQSAGSAYRLSGERLNEEFNRHGEMMRLLLCYTQSLISQMSQTAACNKHHPIDQQLCRWLLLSLDRLQSNRMTMTQELVSHMLGVGHAAVDEAAATLQKSGAIIYAGGQFTVLDRPKLEQLCCECYAAVKNETHSLCPYLAPITARQRPVPALDSVPVA